MGYSLSPSNSSFLYPVSPMLPLSFDSPRRSLNTHERKSLKPPNHLFSHFPLLKGNQMHVSELVGWRGVGKTTSGLRSNLEHFSP